MPAVPVITIDGPSGVGKGTVAQHVAQHAGWHYLDSGAVYRVAALLAAEAGIENNIPEVVKCIGDLELAFDWTTNGTLRILANGRDVSGRIRIEACGDLASRLAVRSEVRAALLDVQRAMRLPPGLVADGRDMGTVVFPDATVKIFLTASPEIRAKRRYNQLKQKGFDVNLARLYQDLARRDQRDQQRKVAPLLPAAEAILLDTSRKTIQQVVDEVIDLIPGPIADPTVAG